MLILDEDYIDEEDPTRTLDNTFGSPRFRKDIGLDLIGKVNSGDTKEDVLKKKEQVGFLLEKY